MKQPAFNRAAQAGFTFVELLAGVAVTVALGVVATSSLSPLLESVKLSSVSNGFLAGIHLARSEAMARNSGIVLCKSADGAACTASGGWEQGWIIFDDANGNGVRDGTESIIQRELPLASSFRLSGSLNSVRYVAFAPTGKTNLVGGGTGSRTLTICSHGVPSGEARRIVWNSADSPLVQKTSLASCL